MTDLVKGKMMVAKSSIATCSKQSEGPVGHNGLVTCDCSKHL